MENRLSCVYGPSLCIRVYAWKRERDHKEKRSTELFAPMFVRPVTPNDDEAVRQIITPIIRAGETYALPPDWTEAEALAYWRSPAHTVFVADDGAVVGTYYIRPNQRGGGNHVANCAFMTASAAAGRGVGGAMCAHALQYATAAGYVAMQFNFVVSTNSRAIALWRRLGFEIVGRLPGAFRHPTLGLVDAFVMYRKL
jgi:ribosomal protein S18 acetylase RimI-like enzyme